MTFYIIVVIPFGFKVPTTYVKKAFLTREAAQMEIIEAEEVLEDNRYILNIVPLTAHGIDELDKIFK